MRILVTGARGLIGSAVVSLLQSEMIEVVPYDIADGDDILNVETVTAAAKGCDGIVHAAGGRGGAYEPTNEVITHNVTGNWNVLNAAKQHGIGRVVTFSSVNALGCFRGETKPDYLPIDDHHPTRPPTAYGMSKRLIEEMCRCFTLTTGIATIVFRPPAVLGPARHAQYVAARTADPAAEWTPFWEYGAYIDVRDVAGAVLAALRHPHPGHLTALITADDTSSPVPVRDLARKLLPDIPWRGPEPADPAAPIVRADRAKQALGWSPRYRWIDCGTTP